MQPKDQGDLTSWSDFCRIVLDIIAEQSPCSQPTLFLIAISRGLPKFGDGSLGELKQLLGRCVQDLKARGLVQLDGEHLVLTPARSAENEDILELTAEVPTNQTLLQTQAQIAGSPKPPREATRERTNAAPAPNAEDEDILELTAEVELHEVEDILELTAEVELDEVEDILELTAELELHPSLRPYKREEAATNQTQRACEPTREEIIAAMRRFISDE